MGELMRSFIAVPVPPEVVKRMVSAIAPLRSLAPQVKWVEPEAFHITLKFLGEAPQAKLERTWGVVSAEIRKMLSFTINFRGVGAFPNLKRPRVIWAGVEEGKAELVARARQTEQVCAACGFEPDNRPYQAHVTLGRVREPAPDPQLAARLEELSETAFGEARVDRVLLMKSELTRKGAIYTVLGEAKGEIRE